MDVFRVFQIEAAHRLPNVPEGHKCARMHGHSFRIEIHISGPVGQETGWVMDFADLRRAFQPLYDHRGETTTGWEVTGKAEGRQVLCASVHHSFPEHNSMDVVKKNLKQANAMLADKIDTIESFIRDDPKTTRNVDMKFFLSLHPRE